MEWFKNALIKQLDRSNQLDVIESTIATFSRTLQEFRTLQECNAEMVSVILLNLREINEPILREFIINEPQAVKVLIKSIVLDKLELSIDSLYYGINSNQVTVYLVVPPNLSKNVTIGNGITFITCDIIQKTDKILFNRSTTWKCMKTTCCQTINYFRGTPTIPRTCLSCNTPLIISGQNTSHYTLLKLIANTSPNNDSMMSPLLTVKLNHDVAPFLPNLSELQLGATIDACVVRSTKDTDTFDLWGWQPSSGNNMKNDNDGLSKVEALRLRLENNPYAFVKALSAQIGAHVFPAFTCLRLKMAMLLSLANTQSKHPISLLAVSTDTYIVQKLMMIGSRLAARSVKPITPAVNIAGELKGQWQRAGQLLLADRGVCNLGAWSPGYVGTKAGTSILNALESGTVLLDGVKGEKVSLSCSLWTHISKSRKGVQQELDALVKVFGIAWNCDDVDKELTESTIEQIVTRDKLRDRNTSIDFSEHNLKAYIEKISHARVLVSKESMEFLQRYFLFARKMRDNPLSINSLDPLVALTEAHARLNQRQVTSDVDVIAAIELYERTLGPASRVMSPPPEDILQFADWLRETLNNCNDSLTQ